MKDGKKQNVIAIVGPTASGKSELAVFIAKKIGGEVISADSRQIYAGLNIGSGKVCGRWVREIFMYKNIPHHCIDIADPRKTFTVADFLNEAADAVRDISMRRHIPIVAGGTGFYINSFLYGYALPSAAPNKLLRKKLGKKPSSELFTILQKMDPMRAASIDRHNPARLIRAIEIIKTTGSPIRELRRAQPFRTLFIGIAVPKKDLVKKIGRRLDAHLASGFIAEVKQLHDKGVSFKRLESLGLEYRYGALFLQKKLSRKEMATALKKAIYHYAKRQMTWFKKNNHIAWIRPDETGRAVTMAKKFLAS